MQIKEKNSKIFAINQKISQQSTSTLKNISQNERIKSPENTPGNTPESLSSPIKIKEPKIAKIVQDWMLNTKIHGLSNVIRNFNIPMKIIWCICLLLSSSFCLYQVRTFMLSFHFSYRIKLRLENYFLGQKRLS